MSYMLGKQHLFVTWIFLLGFLSIIVFSYFNSNKITSLSSALLILFNVLKTNYLLLLLFSVGVMLSATAPDIDISSNVRGFPIWNKITRVSYLVLTKIMKPFFPADSFSHRHLYHSVFGLVIYGVIIFILSFSMSFCYVMATTLFVHKTLTFELFFTALSLLMSYSLYFFTFVIGCSVGFFSHLLEDTITVSGINYLPFITKYRLAGKFITCGKQGYKNMNTGKTTKVPFYKRSSMGATLLSVYGLVFLVMFFYFSIYLSSFLLASLLFLLGFFVFSVIFCGLRIKK